MLTRRSTFTTMLGLSAVLFFLNHLGQQLPVAKPVSAPASEFSGERAFTILESLLQEDRSHPVGSDLNKLVKQRLVDELDSLGIATSEQASWSCSFRYNSCAFVENVIGVIPGESDTGYVALMSHYDSVPMAPGAGDDGAAVAAMLESARALMLEAPFKRPIILLFTDAEEAGLIGAEAFFRHHKLADKIAIVLDFEGSGTTGLSQVLRTSGANKLFLDAFARESSTPTGASLSNELFKRMPNDTDFSVVQRAGLPGIDFAFAGERNHYHTPNDNLENIDHRTIQHHGENMLPLTRWLANSDFDTDEASLVYGNYYGGWLQWPTNYSPFFLLLSIVLLGVAFWRLQASLLGTLAGIGGAALVAASTIITALLIFKSMSFLQGASVSWPAHALPYRIALFGSTLTGGLLSALLINRYLNYISALIGAWLFWVLLAIPLAIYMPDAANILILPLLSGAAILAAASLLSSDGARRLLPLSLVLLLPGTLGLVLPLESSQGYQLIAGALPFMALFMTIFVPLIHGSRLRWPILGGAVFTTLAIIVAIASPLYSLQRPQLVNLHYFHNVDTGAAYYQVYSQQPLPDNIRAVLPLNAEPKALLAFTDTEYKNWVKTTATDMPAPEMEILSVTNSATERSVSVMLRSPRAADRLQLTFANEVNLLRFQLEGIEFEAKQVDVPGYHNNYLIQIHGVYDKDVPLKLIFGGTETVSVYLSDSSTELPESAAGLLEQRQGLSSPVHRGDQAILFRKLDL